MQCKCQLLQLSELLTIVKLTDIEQSLKVPVLIICQNDTRSNKLPKNKTSQNTHIGVVKLHSRGFAVCLWGDKGISKCSFAETKSNASALLADYRGQNHGLKRDDKQVQTWLLDFNKGNKIPIHFTDGTKFQTSVWKRLLRVPKGSTINYGQIAKDIKSPKAVRAVGSAVGANPVFLFNPCHRVLPKSGKVGGYAHGSKVKEELLRLEGVLFN